MQNTLKAKFKALSVFQPIKHSFCRIPLVEHLTGNVSLDRLTVERCRLDALEEKWSQAGEPGKEAYRWFVKNKTQSFLFSWRKC